MFKFALLVTLAVASYGATIPEEKTPEIGKYIVGGRDTDISEVPYQVAMFTRGIFICGGCIVTPTMIVTTASCIRGESASKLTFRAGSTNLHSGGVVAKVKNIWGHPDYTYETMEYDIAVVELTKPLQFSDSIQPIQLATSEPADGSEVKVSGWGMLREMGADSETLQSVLLPIVNRRTCKKNYSGFRIITPMMICAGVEGKSSCYGDGGGPVVSDGKLAGVVSFGRGCARKNLPSVFTNIVDPEITEFIREHAKI